MFRTAVIRVVGASALASSLLLASLSAEGSAAVHPRGIFGAPQGFAISGSSHMWVSYPASSTLDGSVYEFHTTGGYVHDFQGPVRHLKNPGRMTADTASVWIADQNRVICLNAANGALRYWLHGASFNGLSGIYTNGTYVWVSDDGNNKITEFKASNGSGLHVISGTAYHFSTPDEITTNGTDVWVTNVGNNTVTEFSYPYGGSPHVISGFSGPSGIAYQGGNVWVTNASNSSVSKFAAPYGAPAVVPCSGSCSTLTPVGITTNGTHMWILDAHAATDFHVNGTFVKTLLPGFSAGRYPYLDDGHFIAYDSANGDVYAVTEIKPYYFTWFTSGDVVVSHAIAQ